MPQCISPQNAPDTPKNFRWTRYLLFSLLLISALPFCQAQTFVPTIREDLQFQNLSVQEGLPAPNVYKIHQDSAGFLWFGTDKGASRFDGMDLRAIVLGIGSCLTSDTHGRLWIGADGLTCIDRSRDSLVTYLVPSGDTNSPGSSHVEAIVEEADGTFWIGHDGGLDKFDPRTVRFTHITELVAPLLTSMIRDERGRLWIGTRTCVVRFDPNTHEIVRVPIEPRGAWVSVTIGPDGTVWVCGNLFFGLYAINPVSLRLTEWREKEKRIDAVSVTFDHKGKMYIGTMTEGLKVFDPASGMWTTFRHRVNDPTSILSDHIHDICIDLQGNLWLGTAHGVSWAPRQQNRFFYHPHGAGDSAGPPPGEILAVAAGSHDNAWIGSWGGGLVRYDARRHIFSRIPHIGPEIYAVCTDETGSVWASTNKPAELWRVEPQQGEPRRVEELFGTCRRLPRAPITALTRDHEGVLWLGIEGITVASLHPRTGHLRLYDLDRWENPVVNSVRQLCSDSRGIVWVAGGGDGLVRLDPHTGAWKRLPVHKRVSSICEDRSDRLWIGSDTGLYLIDHSDDHLTEVLNSSVLGDNGGILDIIEDAQGGLWLVTERHLFRYDTAEKTYLEFGPADGYPVTTRGRRYMRGTKSAFLPGTGTIVIGTGNGIVTFRPPTITVNPKPPQVVITDILAPADFELREGVRSLVQFRLPERIDLPYNRSALEIRFAALDFASPTKNTYAICMQGIDQEWVNIGHRHSVYYGALSPGEYVFQVRAANSNGVWNTRGANVRVVVNPPFWETLWFRLFAALAIATGIAFITRMRYAQQLKLERLRVRIASDLHDEVGSSLSSIALLTDLVRDAIPPPRPERDELQEISQVARRTADTLRDIVWVTNPNHDHFEKLVDRMKDTAHLLLGPIPFTFASNVQDVGGNIGMEFRRHLLLAYKEILHNVSAHAEAKTVRIELERHGERLILRVHDDGVGFCPETVVKGNGLQILGRRAEQMNGSLLIDAAPGRGTTVEMTFRIP